MSFLFPLFLAASGLIAIPVILHFMNRHVPNKIIFPSIRFIMKDNEYHKGKRGLQDKILLLIRILLILIITLLFAKPFLEKAMQVNSRSYEEIVFFYDLSYSMSSGDSKRFFKQETEKILAAHPNARVAAVFSSHQVEKLLKMGTTQTRLFDSIKSQNVRYSAGNHNAAFNEITPLFSHELEIKKYLYVLSDIQKYDWQKRDLTIIDPSVHIKFVKKENPQKENLAILSVSFERMKSKKQKLIQCTVTVKNYGLNKLSCPLILRAGQLEMKSDITVQASATHLEIFTLVNPPSNTATARLDINDQITGDNSYAFWIANETAVQVAVISDSKKDKAIEEFFLKKIISIKESGYTHFACSFLKANTITADSLEHYQIIYSTDSIYALNDTQMKALNQWMKNGGLLIYFSGKKSDASLSRLNKFKMSQVKYNGIHGDFNKLKAYFIGSVNKDSQVMSIFVDGRSDLNYLPIYRHIRFKLPDPKNAIFSAPNGDALLTHETLGNGHLFCFAVNLSPEWSDFPTSLSIVPLLRNIMNLLSAGSSVLSYSPGDEQSLRERGIHDFKFEKMPSVTLVNSIPVETNVSRMESSLQYMEDYQLSERNKIEEG
ncbi:MAG: BatA domain-containing protein, partial [Lentisphaeria bacterium]|nr:BatA domain-containing protein [Lentisphaeria bacterium]NQZ66560.1 BatA domain-containing protein [Lentisphaeria bacterium]